MSAVHAVYRYAATENLKARPPYFAKGLALASFVRALERAGGEVSASFFVDGPLDEGTAEVMSAHGTVLAGRYGSNRASYRAALTLPRTLGLAADVVWFAEDDYLYEPGSLTELARAAAEIPEASWFALSGPTPPVMLEMRIAQGPVRIEPLARPGGTADVGGTPWRRIDSTTSTFGGRTAAIVRDERLLRAVPYTGAAWDRTTCLAVQGITPYPWPHVLRDLVVPSTPREHRVARVSWRLATRVAINVRSMRRPGQRGALVAPVTPLVGHMNLPYEERPAHWDAVAADTAAWAARAGIAVRPAP